MNKQTSNIVSINPALKWGLKKLFWLKNKYLLAITAFCIWMFFFDKNDFFSQSERMRRSAELKSMEEKKGQMIIKTRKELDLLKTNAQTIEKYARENYQMKKDNEDLFLITGSSNVK